MHNDGAQFMKKLSNTEGEFKKKRILLNYMDKNNNIF